VVSSAAQIGLPALLAGASSISAVYSGDAANKSSIGKATVTVLPAVLTVTANNVTKAQGDANPVFTSTITGFVDGDTSATAVSGAASLTTTATLSSVQGTYPITAAIGTLKAAKYTFAFTNGTLTVGPPPPADFTLTALPTALSVTDGQVITTSVSLASLHNYAGTAKLSCTDLPKNVVCYFASTSLNGDPTAENATTSTTLTVTTDNSQHISANRMPEIFSRMGLSTMALVIFFIGRRRRGMTQFLKLTVLLLIVSGASSCANTLGKSVATPGSYTFNVTAVDGSLSKTVPVTLTIK
jgi:hypothetical protein